MSPGAVTYGAGTVDDPWILKTPSLSSDYKAWRDESRTPPAVVVQVGTRQGVLFLRVQLDKEGSVVFPGRRREGQNHQVFLGGHLAQRRRKLANESPRVASHGQRISPCHSLDIVQHQQGRACSVRCHIGPKLVGQVGNGARRCLARVQAVGVESPLGQGLLGLLPDGWQRVRRAHALVDSAPSVGLLSVFAHVGQACHQVRKPVIRFQRQEQCWHGFLTPAPLGGAHGQLQHQLCFP